jgi:hypothetical protein
VGSRSSLESVARLSQLDFEEDRRMPVPVEYQEATRGLALGVTMIAAFLGLRQWYERKGRDEPTSAEEARYFRRQDVRRWIGVAVMLALAADVLLGSWVAPQVGGRGNPRFVAVWFGVLSLIVVMLLLAFVDWMATRAYGLRQRRTLFREQIDELRRQIKTKAVQRGEESSPGPASDDD